MSAGRMREMALTQAQQDRVRNVAWNMGHRLATHAALPAVMIGVGPDGRIHIVSPEGKMMTVTTIKGLLLSAARALEQGTIDVK